MKKLFIVTVCLLIVSAGINLHYMFDYYPMPKEASALEWNPEFSYTLAYPDDESSSIIISSDENYNPQQYVKLDNVYKHVLMIDDGIIISNETESVKYTNEEGMLKEEGQTEFYDLGSFMSSELSIGAGSSLQVQKQIIASDIKNDEFNTKISDANIYQTYPLEYNKAFVIDGVNYIPHDFDSLTLRS